MYAHEKCKDGLTVFLHFFASGSCVRKSYFFFPGEKRRLTIEGETLGTVLPLVFCLERRKEGWLIDGSPVREEEILFIGAETAREVLLILSEGKTELAACGRIPLAGREVVRIGGAYHNEVFYRCLSQEKDRQFSLVREKESYVLRMSRPEKKDRMRIYINGRTAQEGQLLCKGDSIEFMGLSLLFYPNLLVCSAFFGTLRTAERREEMEELWSGIAVLEEERRKEENPTEEAAPFHTEEMELELPEPEKTFSQQPLFLTAGPAATMVLPMALTAMLGSRLYGGAEYYRISLVMTAASAFLSLFWGMVNHRYAKYVSHREEKQRREDYRNYLRSREEYLEGCVQDNRKAMLQRYPSCESILSEKGKNAGLLRKGFAGQEDFFVRLGLGEIPFQVRLRLAGGRKQSGDILGREALLLAEKYKSITGVPIGIDLRSTSCVAVTGADCMERFLPVLLQMSARGSAKEFKIAFFYDWEKADERALAGCLKWMPHVWIKGRQVRLLAGNEQEAGEILPDMIKELQKEQGFYLILIAREDLVKGEALDSLLADKGAAGKICTVFFERTGIFHDCQYRISFQQNREEIICYQKKEDKRQEFLPDGCTFPRAEAYLRRAARWSGKEQREGEIPAKVSFLELYGCARVEDLNCCGRWRHDRTQERMKVPIGKGMGGKTVCLDIHEKFHGPHGLIAGTTGAGKSELLQTYLLSLSVSFSPEEVNFFIIDYKGGGMGNTLCRLPHCAGVISNLSGSGIRRALVSIKSENMRRQRMFQEAGVSHVGDYAGKYREGKVSEPIPHLLIVVDEFAELRREQPEFMKEMISVSQVGRSLGIHLLLATQKPAGTVDDRIWSNTRFRLCLRVADKQDSMDMLHRPEAAALTGAGRGYLQVGNNELYELFQAGYSQEPYDGREEKKGRAVMVSLTGRRFQGDSKNDWKCSTQLQAIGSYLEEQGQALGYENARKLWLPELPEKLSLEEALGQEGKSGEPEDREIRFCLGRCDDPENQSQYPLYYVPAREGHLCLCGAPASGKSTFLQSFLWQLCQNYAPSQVQFLLAASDSAGVNCFDKMPHCIGNLNSERNSSCFFYHLKRLWKRRKEILKGVGFEQYRKHEKDSVPYLFLLIDSYGSFRQMMGEEDEEFMEKLATEGISCGIYLVITSTGIGSGEIPGRLFDKMKVTMSLEMSDKFQYGDILRQYQIPVFPKENVPGRGLSRQKDRILEFQTPLLAREADDYERIRRIKERAAEKSKKYIRRGFPMIPEKDIYETMLRCFEDSHQGEKSIPIGYDLHTGEIPGLTLEKGSTFLISGAEGREREQLLKNLMEAMERRKIQPFVWEEKGFTQWYREEGKEKCLCIPDLWEFCRAMEKKEETTDRGKEQMALAAARRELFPMIALCSPGGEAGLVGSFWYELFRRNQRGIHLGSNAGNQRMLSFDDLSYAQMSRKEQPGTGYFKTGPESSTRKIFLPQDNRKKKEDREL